MSHQTCTISQDSKDHFKTLRFRKDKTNACLILKINTNELTVGVDQYLQDIKIEDLQEELPDSTPRYLIISYELKHKDGRISYPLCGVYYNPSNSSLNNKMLYASSSTVVFQEAGITGKVA
jgi:hypothetical protein